MHPTPWIIRQSGHARRLRMYCFSYAGGSAASFTPWQSMVNRQVEICAVQLPGRGMRFREPNVDSLPLLIEQLAQAVVPKDKMPFVFFGHSMGGLIAFELTRYCKRHRLASPKHLFVSGCDAPQHRKPSRRLHELDDDGLINALKDYNGTPPEILCNREIMELVIPSIRSDFTMVETYRYNADRPLDLPITVLAGKSDVHLSPLQTQGWQRETTHRCDLKWFDGDHFFINSERQAVLDCVNAALNDMLEDLPISACAGSATVLSRV
jgi:surfactin synthase thioesterase subunit